MVKPLNITTQNFEFILLKKEVGMGHTQNEKKAILAKIRSKIKS